MIIDGGYTKTGAMNEDAKKVFNQAVEGLTGVGYEPLAFATKVVSGTVYRFFCAATLVTPDPTYYDAYVYVYAPIEGKPVIQDIHKI